MSASFASDFFPDLTRLLHTAGLWQLLFPDAVQQRCPTAIKQILLPPTFGGTLEIRWPVLVLLALCGATVGLLGAAALRRRQQHTPSGWTSSFLFFGLMNISAVFCHCLLPAGSVWQSWAMALDVGFTAASSISAAFACTVQAAEGRGQLQRSQSQQQLHQQQESQQNQAPLAFAAAMRSAADMIPQQAPRGNTKSLGPPNVGAIRKRRWQRQRMLFVLNGLAIIAALGFRRHADVPGNWWMNEVCSQPVKQSSITCMHAYLKPVGG